MKKTLIGISCLAAAMLFGQNLVKEGDFTNVSKSLDGFAMTNGGSAVLFTEKDTGNKCVKLAISKIVKTPKNTELTAACLWIPCSRKSLGATVKPGTQYRFSLDLKGSKAMRVNLRAQLWDQGKGLWQGKAASATPGGVNVSTDWKKYEGTFKTGPQTEKAALQIQLWFDTQYGPARFAVGDYVLIDNVVLEEVKPAEAPVAAETAR
ncbi:MAG: carbohydrate binding domain-containing protein [Lentisphaeria bacterium]|nr:carbohydrate binding domain-containing protein [Lentisphaeria bacterium]